MQSLSLSLGENAAVKQRTWNANHQVGHDVSHACPILDIGLLPGIGNVDIHNITCIVGVSFQSMRAIARFGADSKPAEDVTNLTTYRMLQFGARRRTDYNYLYMSIFGSGGF
jgi:hypothetical protein